MSDTRSVTAPTGEYTMIFPGAWELIPFQSDEQIEARVNRIVRGRVGRADRLARTRRMVAQELIGTAKSARDGGAHALYLSMEILPGVPFPAALVATDVPWPAAAGAAPLDDLEAALAAAYPRASVVQHRMGPVARVMAGETRRIGDTETPAFDAEFWIPYPSGRGLLDLIVSAPMAADVELYGLLFDAMVDSLTWKAPLPA